MIVLLTTDFPPLRSSAAVQMRDLAIEMVRQGCAVTVITLDEGISGPWVMESVSGVRILRVSAPNIRSGGNFRRALCEVLIPFMVLRGLRKSPLCNVRWDAAVWYSPSIFFGPIVWYLRRKYGMSTYLILRDIFPEWALDLKLMKRGLIYAFFRAAADLQYSVADTIGIQSPSNARYLQNWINRGKRIEVLNNWLAPPPVLACSIDIARTPLRGRTLFIYIGNVGIAQSLGIFLEVADRLRTRADIGFLIVGRGSDFNRLATEATLRGLDNMMFHSEIEPEEIAGLLAIGSVGLLALDPRHKTHNVPGKFLSYMHAGVPVLARVNSGVDLAALIESEGVGVVSVGDSVEDLVQGVISLADSSVKRTVMARRARALGEKLYIPEIAARQIISAIGVDSASGSDQAEHRN